MATHVSPLFANHGEDRVVFRDVDTSPCTWLSIEDSEDVVCFMLEEYLGRRRGSCTQTLLKYFKTKRDADAGGAALVWATSDAVIADHLLSISN
jgi:hypothetical protein